MSDLLAIYDPAVDAPRAHHPIYDYDSGPPIARSKFGVWLFLASEAMFFTGLIGAYIVLRADPRGWPAPSSRLAVGVTAVNTLILISSSFTMSRAVRRASLGERGEVLRWLGATIALGLVFVAIQAREYHSLWIGGARPNVDLFWSCFYTLTGFHGLHVIAGVLWLGASWIAAARTPLGGSRALAVELAGMYWHFVDAVWVVLFTIVYLL
jgi:heme/copper-type cytochrome/quinol oxidase subunit 3